jgi:hypothetical protein
MGIRLQRISYVKRKTAWQISLGLRELLRLLPASLLHPLLRQWLRRLQLRQRQRRNNNFITTQ